MTPPKKAAARTKSKTKSRPKIKAKAKTKPKAKARIKKKSTARKAATTTRRAKSAKPKTASSRGSRKPRTFTGRIIDDDCVALVVSRKALAARDKDWEDLPDYPRDVTTCMKEKEVVAWGSLMEGLHEIVVELTTRKEASASAAKPGKEWDALPPMQIRMQVEDQPLAMSYGGFRSALMDGGRVDDLNGFVPTFSIPEGLYDVWVLRWHRPMGLKKDGPHDADSRFRVLMVPAREERKIAIRSIPGTPVRRGRPPRNPFI